MESQFICSFPTYPAPLVFEVYNFSVSLAYIFRLEQSDSISLGQRQEYSVQSYFSKNYAERMRKN